MTEIHKGRISPRPCKPDASAEEIRNWNAVYKAVEELYANDSSMSSSAPVGASCPGICSGDTVQFMRATVSGVVADTCLDPSLVNKEFVLYQVSTNSCQWQYYDAELPACGAVYLTLSKVGSDLVLDFETGGGDVYTFKFTPSGFPVDCVAFDESFSYDSEVNVSADYDMTSASIAVVAGT